MEVSGVVLRQLPFLSGTGIDTQSSKLSFLSSKNMGELCVLSNSKICLRSRKSYRITRYGFSDAGHVEYYCLSPKAGMGIKKDKKKKEISEKASLKKKLKLVKGMSKDLLRFSSMGFGVEDSEDSLIGEIKGNKISEATEILLSQLQQLKAEEKELKRKKKEEKAKLKAVVQMNTAKVCESSSSSSSESSDNECGEVVNMNSLRNQAIVEPKIDEPQLEFEVPKTIIQDQNRSMLEGIVDRKVSNSMRIESCSSSGSNVAIGAIAEKIEVCMGGKCKKSGAIALLEEFQQRVGLEGAVVGCKCMGKCRDGPNVRIVKQCNENEIDDDVVVDRTQTNNKNPALCIGVGLEDVSVIVGNFFGQEDRKDMGLVVA
ncbi:Diacylglycerol O-acyltransferase 3, cytosolic [Thalictrum thalictroides]|uniref:Diacylglycerol O-acyltransferase 3, cytosolic n=1 Tax=Thalictrum thalictroides TaxID=46969 RepID=A0A7J6UVR4_THATH|nr:Diacylglycerol O-acyltransferase 3, cytosolic [Thalictrum thalictroides]